MTPPARTYISPFATISSSPARGTTRGAGTAPSIAGDANSVKSEGGDLAVLLLVRGHGRVARGGLVFHDDADALQLARLVLHVSHAVRAVVEDPGFVGVAEVVDVRRQALELLSTSTLVPEGKSANLKRKA